MAAVRGRRGRHGGRGYVPEGEAPEAHVAEEGQRVIKDIVARQTSTSLSLEQQRARERKFQVASAVLPLGCVSAGTSTLRDFTASAERVRRREDLCRLGLPPEDLQLLLEHEEGVVVEPGAARRLAEPERLAREERLRHVLGRLSRDQDDVNEDVHHDGLPSAARPSRHLQELAGLGHEQPPLVRLALEREARGEARGEVAVEPFRDAAAPAPGHPVHRLPALERSLFVQLEGPRPPSATCRKRRRLRKAVDEAGELVAKKSAAVLESASLASTPAAGGSLWDVRDPAQATQRQRPPSTSTRPHGPARPKQYTIRDGKIVELTATTTTTSGPPPEHAKKARGEVFVPTGLGHLSLEELRRGRLTVEQIRELPKFASYAAGSPSSVLYVKNLEHAVTEDDLASVFGAFGALCSSQAGLGRGPGLTFRLCGGRMRGQAFVTFPTPELAGQALAETNGYVLRGRPMIVQYGRGEGREGQH